MNRADLQIVTPENASSLRKGRRRQPVEPPRTAEEIGVDLRKLVEMAERAEKVVQRLSRAAQEGDLICAHGVAIVAIKEIQGLRAYASCTASR